MVGAEDPTACSFNRSGSYVTPDSPCYLTPQLVGSHVIRCSGYSCTRWDYAYFLHFKIVHVGSTYYVRLFQNGEKDAVALVRLVASSLSIIGSAAIVLLVITKRKACNTKIQPILVLSLADCLLAVMWIIGGMVWMKAPQGALGNWCIWILVFTVVFELVTVNVTLVYALTGNYSENIKVWHPFKTAIAYGFAWFEPFFVVLLMLGLFDSGTRIVQEAKECSCW
eukprot:Em0015g256a